MNRAVSCLLACAALAAASCDDDPKTAPRKPAKPDTHERVEAEAKTCKIPEGAAIVPSRTANLDFLCGCTRLEGSIAIDASAPVDLHCLRDVKEISDQLSVGAPVDSEVSLQLEALEQLQQVGTLSLAGLPLSDLTVFASLESVEKISLDRMNELRDLRGLENVVWRELSLTRNAALRTLDGLASPEAITSITLQDNPALANLEGLTEESRVDRLHITQCEALTDLRGLRAEVRELRLEKNAGLRSLDGFIGLPDQADVRIDDAPELESLDGLFRAAHPTIYRLQLFSLPKLARIDLGSASALGALVAQGCTALEEIRGVESIETMQQLHFTGLNAMTRLPNFERLRSVSDLELIELPGLRDLAQLSSLTAVENASLSLMDALTSLHGLERLATGKRVLIEDLIALEALDGLRGLQTVDTLWLQGDRKLQTLAGLTLKRAGELAVRFNDELRSLEGLELLNEVGTLDVSQNPKLTSVRALEGLKQSWKVYVRSNPRLPQCELDWLATALPAGSMRDLAGGTDSDENAACPRAASSP